jgi:hypothetical protein
MLDELLQYGMKVLDRLTVPLSAETMNWRIYREMEEEKSCMTLQTADPVRNESTRRMQ